MRRPDLVAIFVAGSVTIGWATWNQPSQSQLTPLKHRTGTSLTTIAAQAPSTSKLVVIEKDQSPPLFVEPPAGVNQLEFLTSITDVALVVQVTELEPKLTPEKDWVTTTVRARVLDVLKKPAAAAIFAGHDISFQQDGGEIRLGLLTVQATLAYATGFDRGKRYVIFGLRNPDDLTLIIGPTDSYAIGDQDQLVPLAKVGPSRASGGLPLNEAVARIRSARAEKW